MFGNRLNLVLFCLMFAFLAVFIGCTSESKTLKLTPSKLDFGSVYIGDTFSIDVVLKNKYGKAIILTNITITGSNDYTITAGNILPINLDNNAEHTITIEFEPTSDGVIAGLLTIVHDASTKVKEANLDGIGVAVARIVLSENSHDFNKKLINRSHTHDFDVENIGTADLVIAGLNFTGTGAALFKSTTAPLTITPGNRTTITVTFEPIVIGNNIASLSIDHNAVNENSPMIYGVEGEAIDVDPQITLSQTSPWDFGSVATTIPSTQICEIENTGIDPLTVTSATLTTGTEFTVDLLKDSNGNVINFPQIIAVGAKIMLAIKFSPTAKTVYNDTLTFVHDGTNEVTPWDISLTGEGRDEISYTFSYTGSAEQWTVPAGITSVAVECFGAEGGNGYVSGLGGKGGKVSAALTVSPGNTLNVYVGERGKDAIGTVSGLGGWNGGGRGGTDRRYYGGGGGGGCTDIRFGGTALTDRIIVAGAGGGGHYSDNNGGNGGGLTGQDGTYATVVGHVYAGKGGTQTAGGAGGVLPGRTPGSPGSLGTGGNAGYAGGGGGAGYYGGGGAGPGGGGGGSSFTAVGATGVVHTQGVRSGNGEIIVKY